MKKFIALSLLMAVVMVATACVTYLGDDEYYAFDSTIPIDIVAGFFAAADEIWDEDDGELWGFHLRAPLMFADPISRHAVTNMPDPYGHFRRFGDVYVGILPDDVFVSHTMADFSGLSWGMVAWTPEVLLADDFDFMRLLIHEGFHAVQFIEIVDRTWVGGQDDDIMIESAFARGSVLLELEALLAALRQEGDERLAATMDALSIRAERRYRYPQVHIFENMMEINEGLAVFTEILLFDSVLELLDFYEPWMIGDAETTGLGTMFPYFSGAMYALLLRDAGADWQHDLTFQTDLAARLKEALAIDDLTPFDQLELERYGYSEIMARQQTWVEEFAITMERVAAFARGPVMMIPGIWVFEYGERLESLFVPGEHGRNNLIFFGDFSFSSANWRLELIDGHAKMGFPAGLYIAIYENVELCPDARRATAPTWILEIVDDNYKLEVLTSGKIEVVER